MSAEHITWHSSHITREDKLTLFGHKNKVLWFTGLSGSGKSTIAVELEKVLHKNGYPTCILDGDNIRHGLNHDLGFSESDRKENLRRIREVTKLFYDAGITVLVCFISPYEQERVQARQSIGEDFYEIYVKCDLSECESRDPKGLYKKARAGEIKKMTGIGDVYESPNHADCIVDTSVLSVEESVKTIVRKIFGVNDE